MKPTTTNDIMIDTLVGERGKLKLRIDLADDRAERLGATSRAYDAQTEPTQTDEECHRLDRLIGLSNKAHRRLDTLRDRFDMLGEAKALLEQADKLAQPGRK
jgi:hypothetical protein